MNNRATAKINSRSKIRRSASKRATRVDLDKVFEKGLALHRDGHYKKATVAYKKVLAAKPDHADSLHLQGVIYTQQGDYAKACEYIEQALSIDSSISTYHFNYGLSLQEAGNLEAAKKAYRQAIDLEPRYLRAYENLGVCLQDLGEYEDAQKAYTTALSIDPHLPLANQNLATLGFAAGDLEKAATHFDYVLAGNFVNAEVRFKRSLVFLSKGDYTNGWDEYDWRLHTESFLKTNSPKCTAIPTWDGSSLAEKSILIRAEQGIGEEIQFASCFNEIIEQSDRCIIECDPRLVPLFRRSFPLADIIAHAEYIFFEADWQVLAGSLPRVLRRSAAAFPNENAYLFAQNDTVGQWRSTHSRNNNLLKVGISWRGGGDKREAKLRSIELNAYTPLFSLPGVEFINLQYGDHTKEITEANLTFPKPLVSYENIDPLQNLDDFAALIRSLDLVISIDNATVHVAGALGVRTWVLLPHSPDWRWRAASTTCPWYPTVRLFKQTDHRKNNWPAMIEDVKNALAQFTVSRTDSDEPPNGERQKSQISILNAERTTLVLNDTTNWYHWGCSCTSIALKRALHKQGSKVSAQPIRRSSQLDYLPSSASELSCDSRFALFEKQNAELVNKIRHSEQIVVNGEGTIHGANSGALDLLYTAYVAANRFFKPVNIVNHSCFPNVEQSGFNKSKELRELYRVVYSSMTQVVVREPLSQQALNDLGVASTLSFDCLPLFIEEYYQKHHRAEGSPYILLSGSVSWGPEAIQNICTAITLLATHGLKIKLLIGAGAHAAVDDLKFAAAIRSICGQHVELVVAHSEQEWLHTIDAASMLISGRFHHTIAAAFLQTPFVVTSSNTPKIEGVLNMLSLDKPLDPLHPKFQERLFEKMNEYTTHPESGLLTAAKRAEALNLCAKNVDSEIERKEKIS